MGNDKQARSIEKFAVGKMISNTSGGKEIHHEQN